MLEFVSAFGSNIPIMLIVVSLTTIVLVINDFQKEAILLFFTLASHLYAQILKGIFRNPRPTGADFVKWIPFDKYGLPSGHTIFYTVFWGFVMFLTFKIPFSNNIIKYAMRLVAGFFIAFVGISRVKLGEHFVIDAVAGYFFGGLFLVGLLYLYKQLH